MSAAGDVLPRTSIAVGPEEAAASCAISVVIPTYGRDEVLLQTVRHLLRQEPPAREILVVDQTRVHEPGTDQALRELGLANRIRWLNLAAPSIPHAMNVGLLEAREEIVLFVDDDIVPAPGLVAAHARAHGTLGAAVVAGRVVQPWETGVVREDGRSGFRFSSATRRWVEEFMGGNFSVKRSTALELGGFDENFVRVAYRFERDFGERVLRQGGRILFEPEASVRHLKATEGGTRAHGHHLTTIRPSHAVGEYYYLLRRPWTLARLRRVVGRPVEAVMTRHHLRRPWWIPVSLTAEVLGFWWAVRLASRGPRYVGKATGVGRSSGST